MKEEKIYLTKEGLAKLKKEYQELLEVKKIKAKGNQLKGTAESKLLGYLGYYPLSEDKSLNLLDERLLELERILKRAEVIKKPRQKKLDRVVLGATVIVESEGQTDEFTVVGRLEANPSIGKISNESPVGQALLGKRVNETITINSPEEITYKIKRITYKNK